MQATEAPATSERPDTVSQSILRAMRSIQEEKRRPATLDMIFEESKCERSRSVVRYHLESLMRIGLVQKLHGAPTHYWAVPERVPYGTKSVSMDLVNGRYIFDFTDEPFFGTDR